MINSRSMLIPAALAIVLAVPVTGFAQVQSSPPPYQSSPAGGRHHPGAFGFMGIMRSLNLTTSQQTQIRQIVQQFRQAHPPGSARDPQVRKQLQDKIMAVLTPAQQQQLKTKMQQRRSRRDRDQNPAPSPSP